MQRRGWDSNPRYLLGTRALQARPFDRSGTSPHYRVRSVHLRRFPSADTTERVGFEPTVPDGYTRFRGVRLRPLGHLSKVQVYYILSLTSSLLTRVRKSSSDRFSEAASKPGSLACRNACGESLATQARSDSRCSSRPVSFPPR